jgi:hypothetical protein|tara:strand:- start:5236 stop:5661 length:426 start_codon:yes stop_codon:yes gene_type:complete
MTHSNRRKRSQRRHQRSRQGKTFEAGRKKTLTKQQIIALGDQVSGGFGFWGHSIRNTSARNTADNAWIDALREKGLGDEDIAFYGDWSDARHIADGMEDVVHKYGNNTNSAYLRMKRLIKDSSRNIKEIELENQTYRNRLN